MLSTTKSITITGHSRTENGELLASMRYNIASDGSVNSSENISQTGLYESNIGQVRNDIDEFKTYCRIVEDEVRAESTEVEE